jgi:hypothetical protein
MIQKTHLLDQQVRATKHNFIAHDDFKGKLTPAFETFLKGF